MALWEIPVRWECGGTVLVEAPTIRRAIEMAQFAPFPDEDWRDDEFYVDDQGDADTRYYYNDDQPDEKVTEANEIFKRGTELQVRDTGEIVTVEGYDVSQDGIVSYYVKSCGDLYAHNKYTRNELCRVEENQCEVCNVLEFLNQ